MVTSPALRVVPSVWRTVAIAAAGLLLPLLWPGLLRHLFDRLSPMVGHGSMPATLTTLHLGTDALIGAAYTFISAVLAYIVFGRQSPATFPTTLDLAVQGSGGADVTIYGATANDSLSICAAGDVNGDGTPDLILDAYADGPAEARSSAGETYIVFGRKSPATFRRR